MGRTTGWLLGVIYLNKIVFMKLYYLIWVDCILRLRSQPENKENWRFWSMIFITVPMSSSFIFIVMAIEHIIGHRFELDIPFLPDEAKGPVSFIIIFILPWIVINYFLIFKDRKYKKLIRKYKYHNGKLFITFLAIAIFTPIIVLWIGLFIRD